MKFELTEIELSNLEKVKDKIKKKNKGKLGKITFLIKQGSIGDTIAVYSNATKKAYDITDYGCW